MKKLCLGLAFTLLVSLTAPWAAWSAVFGGPAGGQGGAFGRGGGIGGNPAGGGSALNPAGPSQSFGGRSAPVGRGRRFDDSGRLDAEGRFDHDGEHRFGRGCHPRARFAYPLCYAYAFCPLPYEPCVWQGGYWITEPGVTDDGFEVAEQVWVPPGCY